jgi:hypothetical protein
MTMHKTTRALLEFLRHTTTAFPKETPQYHDWREAGYPDLDEPEHEPKLAPGTCWTCRHAPKDKHEYECEPCFEGGEVDEWVGTWWKRRTKNENGFTVPPRNYSGPPCPGWDPKR